VLEAVAAYERKLEADHPEYFHIGKRLETSMT
jgi:hypothetical protein